MIGGIVSKTAVYPLDLCKKRLQIQKFHQSRTTYGESFVCKGLVDCLSRTVKREGWMGEFESRRDSQSVCDFFSWPFQDYTKACTHRSSSQVSLQACTFSSMRNSWVSSTAINCTAIWKQVRWTSRKLHKSALERYDKWQKKVKTGRIDALSNEKKILDYQNKVWMSKLKVRLPYQHQKTFIQRFIKFKATNHGLRFDNTIFYWLMSCEQRMDNFEEKLSDELKQCEQRTEMLLIFFTKVKMDEAAISHCNFRSFSFLFEILSNLPWRE